MKKLLGILVLGLLISSNAHSLSKDKLAELVSEANTRGAAGLIYDYCMNEDAFLEILYSKNCKCAIKVGKAKTGGAAGMVAELCGL
jgi:hypothetical protein